MGFIRSAGAVAGVTVTILAGSALAGAPPAVAGAASGSVTPSIAAPGTRVTFAVSCASLNASSATLFGVQLGLPDRIPMDVGLHAGTFAISVNLPATIAPGSYSPSIDCSDGSSTTVALRVNALPGGGPSTGDGSTSTATNSELTVAGIGLLGLGIAMAGLARHRRRSARS